MTILQVVQGQIQIWIQSDVEDIIRLSLQEVWECQSGLGCFVCTSMIDIQILDLVNVAGG